MNLIFIGSVVDKKTLNSLPDASVAGNKMQMGFIQGFLDNGINIDVLSVEPHGMWKFNKKPIFVKAKKMEDDGVSINSISYINLPAVKQLDIIHKLKNALKNRMKTKDTVLIVYNTMSIFAIPTLKIARKYGLKCGAIIADLPIIFKKNIIRRIEDKKQISYIGKFDFLIPLTKYIQKDFAPNLPFEVVESGCNPKIYDNLKPSSFKDNKKHIVFSGTLNLLSGIDLIIDAMENVDESVVLDIYGCGPDIDRIKNKVIKKNNIVLHDRVTNDEMIEIQAVADLLVCPRVPDDFTTKYTFPSKIMEYICSGNPVLCNRLLGIPDEYDGFITIMNDSNPIGWAEKINDILIYNPNIYKEKATKAKDCIFKNKKWSSQCKRVVENILIKIYE